MALKNEFYSNIFEYEKKWIDQINNNLLNIVYCNLALRPFYLERKKELKDEYDLTGNALIGQVLKIVDKIIEQLDILNEQYKSSKFVDIKSLLPLFLTNRMNNAFQSENENLNIDNWKIKRQILEDRVKDNIKLNLKDDYDYLYDDFPDEHTKTI